MRFLVRFRAMICHQQGDNAVFVTHSTVNTILISSIGLITVNVGHRTITIFTNLLKIVLFFPFGNIGTQAVGAVNYKFSHNTS